MIIEFLRKRGFVLPGILMACVVFIILAIPIINWTSNEFLWTTLSHMRLCALNLADAGAEAAAWEIIHNDAQFTVWGGSNPKTLTITSFADNNGNITGDIDVTALNTSPNHYLITSTGYVPSKAAQKTKKTVKIQVFPHFLFNNAAFGVSSISVSGIARVDSYDSSQGPYNPLTAGDSADVGTNGSMTISGNSLISGDVLIGPEGSVSGNDPSHVTGETYYAGNPVEIEPVILPDYLSSLPSLGSLNLSSDEEENLTTGYYYYDNISLSSFSILRLSAGTQLYVANDFSVTGHATVYTDPDVAIYIGGDGSFAGGGIINIGGYPDNLQIYGLGSGNNLNFGGSSSFYGAIYAPGANVLLSGNFDYFGAVVAKDISMSGTFRFHYDETLAETGPASGYDIAYWQED